MSSASWDRKDSWISTRLLPASFARKMDIRQFVSTAMKNTVPMNASSALPTKPTSLMTNKQTKAQAIHQALLAVADFYEIPASGLLSEVPFKGKSINRARGMLMSHLHRQGMSHISIGRIVQRSTDSVRTGIARANFDVTEDERALFAALPSIPSTLIITNQP